MQTVRHIGRRLRGGAVLACALVLAAAGPGYAHTGASKSSGGSGGGNDKGTLSASAQGVSYVPPSVTSDPRPALQATSVQWSPPPCWIGPIGGPAEFKRMLLKSVADTNVPGQANYALQAMDELKRHYTDGYTWGGAGDGYKNFNLDQEGKGQFWGPFENPDSTSLHKFDCNSTIPFWVPNGQIPKGTPNVITPEMLARLAEAHTHVPGVTIETNPKTVQTVNLSTWIWLQDDLAPVSVRASVDLGGGVQMWAQTTATATSVHIDPGTADATVFPASGECAVGAGGKVGSDYNGDPKADPPCGVTYLHSTDNAPPYQLDVTATWTVKWEGSGGAGGPLGTSTVRNTHAVTVREIQTVNR